MTPNASKEATPCIVIQTSSRVHQTTYNHKVEFVVSGLDPASRTWLRPMLLELKQASEQKSLNKSEMDNLKKALGFATKLPAWREMVSKRKSDLMLEDIVNLFIAFDHELMSTPSLPPRQAARISLNFRGHLEQYVAHHISDNRFGRLSVAYRSPLKIDSKGRDLISDLPDGRRETLGAIGHTSVAELHELTRATLERDLRRIIDVCNDILSRYERAVAVLEDIKAAEIPSDLEIGLRDWLKSNQCRVDSESESTPEFEEALLTLAVQVLSGIKAPIETPWRNREEVFQYSRRLVPLLRKRIFGISNGDSLAQLIRIKDFLSVEVMLACALTIQCHTTWNFISVLELTKADIDIKDFPHQLQSIKPRTQDETPVVFVERKDELVIRACQILHSRLDRLVQAGRIAPEEKRLWISSRSLFGKSDLRPVAGWDGHLRKLCTKYSLPHFSLEQVRVQGLALISIGGEGFEGARRAAGHLRHATTLHYTDKLLLQRVNSAINLEFERRLEETINFMIDPAKVPPDQLLIAYPIGDGSSCLNPQLPPDSAWMEDGMCNGWNCHAREGCSNRVLEIDAKRIEEVVKTKKYYEENWTRLADLNEVEFEQRHLPSMLFNYALYGVLRRGPFRHVVRIYE